MKKTKRLWNYEQRLLQYFIVMFVWEAVSGQIHYSIPEEMPKGTFVGNIAKDLGMDGKQLLDHGLRVIIKAGTIQYFILNVNRGHLEISQLIDREKICKETEKCIIKFQMLIESKLKLYGIEVEITDINDNAPQFLSKEWTMKISEMSALKEQFPLPKAQDPDLGINSVQNYQLTGSNHFSLEMQRGETRSTKLVLEKSLDREQQSVYDLILTAFDGGDPIRSGIVQIHIIVLDANDNVPVFSQQVYEVNLKENMPKASVIATVTAVDMDEGINGEVKYSFEEINKNNKKMFLLNSTSGEIILVGSLDFETSSRYEVEVQAMDGGGLSDRSKVVILVTDLNDNAPELAITFLINSVPENSPAGTVIAILNAQDRDSGDNGEIKCSIPSNLPFRLKKTMESFYSLETDKALDRELLPTYSITVTAVDDGAPPLSTSVVISLQVLDINDNPPLFLESKYTSYLLENNPKGASVFSLKASDPDWEENARITYSIIDSPMRDSPLSSYLSINSETGTIYALSSLDYEEIQEIQFHVKAQDGGSPSLNSNVSVTLFILDQNDNVPEILYPSPPADGSTGIELAPRSSEPGYLITKVVAVDADSGQNSWLSYQLIRATEPGLFTVGLHTGEIRTARLFLEKDALKQILVVLVKDNGQPPLSASVTLTVVLADSIPESLSDLSNISAPVDPQSDLTFYLVIGVVFVSCLFFTFLLVLLTIRLYRWKNSKLLESGSVHFSGVPVSQFVGMDGVRAFLQSYCHTISLTRDSRKSHCNFHEENCSNTLTNQPLTCGMSDSILACGDLNLKNDEQILVKVSLIFQSQGNISVCVKLEAITLRRKKQTRKTMTAMEASYIKGIKELNLRQVLFLFIFWDLVNCGIPEQVQYSLSEETEKKSFVGNLAKDLELDVKQLSKCRLAVSSEKEYFAFNEQSGDLYVNDRIDREKICGNSAICMLQLEVVAHNPLNIFHIKVFILDINDNAPYFRKKNISLNLSESHLPGARFALGNAEDKDIGINALQGYHLSSTPYFKLEVQESKDGRKYAELILQKPLDREKEHTHHLILTASDGGRPVKTGTLNIEVNVIDINDNPPVFSQATYKTSLKENTPRGTSVLQVKASDSDEGSNAEISYIFWENPENVNQNFILDPIDGTLSLKESIDFEDRGSYMMIIRASDGGGLVADCSVEIEVLDENDNAPEVIITSLSSPILEDILPGAVIALIKVNDRDSGLNGKVTCYLRETVPFQVVSSSDNYFKLLIDGPLDREKTPVYNLTITATDQGIPPLSTDKAISVPISDINDNPPAFEKPSYVAYVPENNPSGMSIFQVKAFDPDLDRNAQITYSILNSNVKDLPLSSYVSINSETGTLYAQRSFDYEQLRDFQLQVQAQDEGSPSLNSSVTVKVHVLDQNDNTPQILYPSQTTQGSSFFEMVPRSADSGYLVTKVVAVDADSGHNAWLSFHLLQATEPSLFIIGSHTGEIQTARALLERDITKQRLVIMVRDNGQPPLSATTSLNLVFAQNFQEALPEMNAQPNNSEDPSKLQFYLVLTLTLVSFLFLVAVILAIIMKLQGSRNPTFFQCFIPNSHSKTGTVFPPNYEDGTLPYSYQICLSTESRRNELTVLRPNVQIVENILCEDKPDTSVMVSEGKIFDSGKGMVVKGT
ncbi:cadherin-23-like [Pseudonaja textilis]|uniref:cadherin-23-like n=1 Tax=Pseudonaja textilis TaxID=8673 RepID=UPI000EAAB329|nr:cadherin-23-like [Pseudonaja textilis]